MNFYPKGGSEIETDAGRVLSFAQQTEHSEALGMIQSVKRGDESFGAMPRELLKFPELKQIHDEHGHSSTSWTAVISEVWLRLNDKQ